MDSCATGPNGPHVHFVSLCAAFSTAKPGLSQDWDFSQRETQITPSLTSSGSITGSALLSSPNLPPSFGSELAASAANNTCVSPCQISLKNGKINELWSCNIQFKDDFHMVWAREKSSWISLQGRALAYYSTLNKSSHIIGTTHQFAEIKEERYWQCVYNRSPGVQQHITLHILVGAKSL